MNAARPFEPRKYKRHEIRSAHARMHASAARIQVNYSGKGSFCCVDWFLPMPFCSSIVLDWGIVSACGMCARREKEG